MTKMSPKMDLADKYKKMTQIEHILKLPDTYIGSTQMGDPMEMWVWSESNEKMEKQSVRIVPGLFKIFDEILVNAYDQWVRCREKKSVYPVRDIRVQFYEDGSIEVRNDGEGIDCEIHPEHGIWIPELIFGHLLTSGNYDQKGKITGGKNGLGSKCTCVYSKFFRVETVDVVRKRKYIQEFRDNLGVREPPVIHEKVKDKPYTKIHFMPDYERFGGLKTLDADHRALFERRVIDLAACTDKTVSVLLNGKTVGVKSLEKYVDYYLGSKTDNPRVYEMVDDRWEIVCALSPNDNFEQISFVNGVSTYKGGKHIDYLMKQITEKLAKAGEKKASKKKVEIKPSSLREHIWLFARTVIEDPSFDSQTKEFLTTPPASFGSKCVLSDGFIERFMKTGVCEKAIALAEFRSTYALQKSDGKKKSTLRGIPKLDDANWAGTSHSKECTLILTEGDSAKSFAIAGLSVIGRDKYGVFPLRGKLLNVRDATVKQVVDNVEINALKQILGLRQDRVYGEDNLGELRYGSVMLLTDADVDGSHIRGLLMNFFHTFWPSLLEIDGFLRTMMTPIVKAKKGNDQKIFYSWAEYQDWKQNNHNWDLRYYKGLGTSTASEAKEYFSGLASSLVKYHTPKEGSDRFVLEYEVDQESDNISQAESGGVISSKKKQKKALADEEDMMKQAFLLAFGKDYSNDRKVWLENYNPKAMIDGIQREVSYDEFVHKDLIHFSKYDCERSVPSLVDGLKPSQRKVIHATFQRNLTKAMKVAQLAAYVAEKTAYHHGEQSLNGAIVGLAQDYVGANNFPLLMPEGQFGSRLCGGKDHASPRYIFTRMNPLLGKLFPVEDLPLLKYLDDDGTAIEPEYFVPILPLVLVNGAEGIGTGFSCRVPTYHPRDLMNNLEHLMNGETMEEMKPWVRGYKGNLEMVGGKWVSSGVSKVISANQLEITELPVGRWTEDYKEQLEDWILNKRDFGVVDYESHYTEAEVRFVVKFQSGVLSDWDTNGKVNTMMKLTESKRFGTTNMHLFNPDNQIRRYRTPLDIIRAFYDVRRDFYVKRKAYQLERLKREIEFLGYRVRFIREVVNGDLEVSRRSIDDIERELREKGYPKARRQNGLWYLMESDTEETSVDDEETGGSYEYLLGMPLRSLSKEKMSGLENEKAMKEGERLELEKKEVNDIWRNELREFVEGFEKQIDDWIGEVMGKTAVGSKRVSAKKVVKKTPVKKTVRQKAQVADSDEE